MILHAASIAAFFVDQLAQAPVQVQCVQQATPESWLKQWIPTAVSLLSIGIGVWIARWSFHASSERDRERWVLDQKKAEWNVLLGKIAEVNGVFQRAESPNPIISMDILMEYLPSTRLLLKECWSRCLFIADVLKTVENKEIYLAFDKKLCDGEREIRASNFTRKAAVPNTEKIPDNFIGNQTLFDQEVIIYNELKAADNSFGSWILSVAQHDLGIKES